MCHLKFILRQGGQQLHDFPHGIGKIWPHWMFSQEHFFSSARQLRLREKSMHSLLANWCVCFFLWKGSYQGRVFGKNETVGLVCIKDGKNKERVNVLSKKRDNLIKAVWSWWWLVCLWRMGRTILNWIEVRQQGKPPKQMNFQKSSKQPLTPLSFSENHILQYNFTRSSGALRAPTSSLRPCGMNPECPRPRTPNPERPNPECPTVAGWGCELYWKYFHG